MIIAAWFTLGMVLGGALIIVGWYWAASSFEPQFRQIKLNLKELERRLDAIENTIPTTPEERRW